jgi:hypothetical protein
MTKKKDAPPADNGVPIKNAMSTSNPRARRTSRGSKKGGMRKVGRK